MSFSKDTNTYELEDGSESQLEFLNDLEKLLHQARGGYFRKEHLKVIQCNLMWLSSWFEFTRSYYCPNSINTTIDFLIPPTAFDLGNVQQR